MAIIINGKEFTKEEALELLKNDDTVINRVKVEFEKEKSTEERLKDSHEGFGIPQDLISQMSETMSAHEAGKIMVSFKGSPKIMGRNLYIIIADPGDEINHTLAEDE